MLNLDELSQLSLKEQLELYHWLKTNTIDLFIQNIRQQWTQALYGDSKSRYLDDFESHVIKEGLYIEANTYWSYDRDPTHESHSLTIPWNVLDPKTPADFEGLSDLFRKLHERVKEEKRQYEEQKKQWQRDEKLRLFKRLQDELGTDTKA